VAESAIVPVLMAALLAAILSAMPCRPLRMVSVVFAITLLWLLLLS
jgi:hypothetical protein